jgi:hypothetical protein
VPELSIVDITDDLIWHANGDVTVLYSVKALHEPSLDDETWNEMAFASEHAWDGLPDTSRYQWYVLVDHKHGIQRINDALPPIANNDTTSQLFDEFRRARLRELTRREISNGHEMMIQERRHFLAATFTPKAFRKTLFERVYRTARRWLDAGRQRRLPGSEFEEAYNAVLKEAATFDRRVYRTLTVQQGLEFNRCETHDIVNFVYELLNPTSSEISNLWELPRRPLWEQDRLPAQVVKESPFTADVSRVGALLTDDLLVRRQYLQIGDRYLTVVWLKGMPDQTEPGTVIPLLRLGREKYHLVYSVNLPNRDSIIESLSRQAKVAEGMRHASMVKTDRTDPAADAVASQANEALKEMISSDKRLFGTTLQVVLIERSPDALNEAVEDTLAAMSTARGMRGYRETFLLQPIFLSMLPGARPLSQRQRKALTPSMVDLQPCYDFRSGQADKGIPFTTPSNTIIFYDPFEFRDGQSNANILIFAESGWGKSVAAQMLLSGYETMTRCHGQPHANTFIIDNGASYKRYMDLRDDARYVAFSFAAPPGVDIFAYDEDEELDAHISRLEWLLVDLLRLNQADEEGFELKKTVLEKALYTLYTEGGSQTFSGAQRFLALSDILQRSESGREMAERLAAFVTGKFARLFEPNPSLTLGEDVHAVCYDFMHLGEHKDFALIALRLVIYEIRRFSARRHRRSRARTFLCLDESWKMLDSGTGGAGVTGMAAPFIAESVRMGRKEGLSVLGLSQQLEDFVQSAYGAAIVGNSATKIIGRPGKGGGKAIRDILQLNDRQFGQLQRLVKSDRYREFLLIQGDLTNVIRVPLDAFSRWVFTTDPNDRDRIETLSKNRSDLALLDQVRYLARESEGGKC